MFIQPTTIYVQILNISGVPRGQEEEKYEADENDHVILRVSSLCTYNVNLSVFTGKNCQYKDVTHVLLSKSYSF